MLKPAICYKEELESALCEYFYTDDMMFYQGSIKNDLIKIADESNGENYQYAVVNSNGKLIGYIGYYIDHYSSCAYGFGAFSFDRGNPTMGKELFGLLERLIRRCHRVEFHAVEGNPAVKGYDKFLRRHKEIGYKHIFKDSFRDSQGKYRDAYLYEFVNPIKN